MRQTACPISSLSNDPPPDFRWGQASLTAHAAGGAWRSVRHRTRREGQAGGAAGARCLVGFWSRAYLSRAGRIRRRTGWVPRWS